MTHATRASDGADGVCAERPKTARARVGRKMTRYKTKKLQWSNRLSIIKATSGELITKDYTRRLHGDINTAHIRRKD